MDLFTREFGKGDPLIILHGLFGSSDNWVSIGKALGDDHHVMLIDQRNHGNSFHSEEFTYDSMVGDLHDYIVNHNITDPVILGHSMGGKVAMHFSLLHPHLIKKLIVADIAPREYEPRHYDILEAMESMDLDGISSRKQADEYLGKFIAGADVRNFLMKSLTRGKDHKYKWKLNLRVIHREIENISADIVSEGIFEKPSLFMRGGDSDYILDDDKPMIKKLFPRSLVLTINNAGHWLQHEKPAEFVAAVKGFLAG